MQIVKLLTKLLLILLILWALYVSVTAFFGVQLYFPLRLAEAEPIPYHRWQSVRISVFLTLCLFMIIYLFDASKTYSPIRFFEVLLWIYSPVLAFFTYRAGAGAEEYIVVGFFAMVAGLLNLSSQDRVRKYFQRK